MHDLYLFTGLGETAWGAALGALRAALADKDKAAAAAAYRELLRALATEGDSDLLAAAAAALLYSPSSVSRAAAEGELPKGLRMAALLDLETVLTQLGRDWTQEARALAGGGLPPLSELAAPPQDPRVAELARSLRRGDALWLLEHLLAGYRQHGSGPVARFEALRWSGRGFVGVAHPVRADMNRLVGLERQLELLKRNTLAFLADQPAHHTLLYGPRGSGKSTAIRSLVKLYGAAGLRLVELAPQELVELSAVIEALRGNPHHFILFLDDLSFEAGDTSYHPLKSLLEGSLAERPENVLIYATSNRRHLVREGFKDRPDPLDDDVHAWDTHNERLALADRFGLTITFPSATQQRYLEVVRGLAERDGLAADGLDEKAIRYAEWGNGYSGRTAQQFIDALKAGRA